MKSQEEKVLQESKVTHMNLNDNEMHFSTFSKQNRLSNNFISLDIEHIYTYCYSNKNEQNAALEDEYYNQVNFDIASLNSQNSASESETNES